MSMICGLSNSILNAYSMLIDTTILVIKLNIKTFYFSIFHSPIKKDTNCHYCKFHHISIFSCGICQHFSISLLENEQNHRYGNSCDKKVSSQTLKTHVFATWSSYTIALGTRQTFFSPTITLGTFFISFFQARMHANDSILMTLFWGTPWVIAHFTKI